MTTVNVRYMVEDVDAAVAFYTTHLGFTLLSSAVPAFADVTHVAIARVADRAVHEVERSSAGDGEQGAPGGERTPSSTQGPLRTWPVTFSTGLTAPHNHRAEVGAFGWWFVSDKLDAAWAVTHLRKALAITSKTDLDNQVVQRLATIAASWPEEAVECLDLLVSGDEEGWRIYGWREGARQILGAAIASNDAGARESAIRLVHRLGARGYREFRDLLP